MNSSNNSKTLESLSDIAFEGPWLGEMLTMPEAQKSELRKKNSVFVYKSIHPADLAEFEENGWEAQRAGKRSTRIKKPKPASEVLEDRAWKFLYRMGFKAINSNRFTIKFNRDSGTEGSKQIDAFAVDNEIAIVIECKSKKSRGRRTLQKDIGETVSLKEYIIQSIHDHFDDGIRRKVIWIYATENIIWSDNDIERAEDAGIYIITENELRYFEAFLQHMGPAGKYQILGEFLKDQKVPALQNKQIPAIRGKIGGEKFFSFVTTPRSLLKIAFVNHQALNHPDGKPAYQRMVSSTRIKQIGEFIKKSGYFPTNLLVNFSKSVKFDLISNKENTDSNIKFGWLTLPSTYRSAWIIDGQHRLFGYSGLDDKYLDQSVFVVAFEKMAAIKEADLFITINHKQKSVPSALLTALLADLKLGDSDPKVSINAVGSAIVRKLNTDKSSPLSQRFVLPDMPAGDSQNLTIPEAVKGIVRSALTGRVIHNSVAPGPLSGGKDEDTIIRASTVFSGYFDALREANEERWEAGRSAFMCTNPAIRAHLTLIGEIINYKTMKTNIDFHMLDEKLFIKEIVEFAKPVFHYFKTASDDDVKNNYSRKFGEGGVKEYTFNLCSLILESVPDFGSDDFRRFIEQQADSQIEEANHFLMKLSENLSDYVVAALKGKYGTGRLASGEYAYWELGVTDRKIAENAYKKSLEEPVDRRKPKEAYLEVLDLKKIVESKDNWVFFEDVFNIPLPSEKRGSRKYHTSWMALFNDVRKIAAHKSKLRTYTDEDLEFIDWLRSAVAPNLEQALGGLTN